MEERCYIYRKVDGGSRRHGAAEVRQRVRVDGYMQDGGVVWRRGGVDDRPGKDDASVPSLEMDQWKMALAASASAPGRCVTQYRYVAGLGNPGLDVRLRCDVCCVLGSDCRHTFIKGIRVAMRVA